MSQAMRLGAKVAEILFVNLPWIFTGDNTLQ